MASKLSSSTPIFFLILNILFFTMVSSTHVPSPPPPYNNIVPSEQPAPQPRCPKDTLKLGVCANLLNDNGPVKVVIGTPPKTPCCTLIQGLVDLEAAVCLCTVIRAKALVLNIDIGLALNLVLNSCGKKVPNGFKCPA